MILTRRECLAGAATVSAGLVASRGLMAAASDAAAGGLKVGMCDWSLGQAARIEAFDLARRIGLDGVQVSVGFPEDNLKLRRPEVQEEFLAAARKHKLAIASLALGVLNNVPLMSEPRAAIWVADAIEVARKMRTPVILLAFFGKGELKEENAEDMRRVTEVMQELAPRAEKAGVILGLETYLSAEAHLKIIDAARSKAVQVYYDVFNASHAKHDPLREIRMLGVDRICEIHFKEGRQPLGSGAIDWPAVVATLKELKYRGWIVLETGSPKDVVEDTKVNLQYVKRLFGAA